MLLSHVPRASVLCAWAESLFPPLPSQNEAERQVSLVTVPDLAGVDTEEDGAASGMECSKLGLRGSAQRAFLARSSEPQHIQHCSCRILYVVTVTVAVIK